MRMPGAGDDLVGGDAVEADAGGGLGGHGQFVFFSTSKRQAGEAVAVAPRLEARRRVGIRLERLRQFRSASAASRAISMRATEAPAQKMRTCAEGQMPVRPAVEAHLLGGSNTAGS